MRNHAFKIGYKLIWWVTWKDFWGKAASGEATLPGRVGHGREDFHVVAIVLEEIRDDVEVRGSRPYRVGPARAQGKFVCPIR